MLISYIYIDPVLDENSTHGSSDLSERGVSYIAA